MLLVIDEHNELTTGTMATKEDISDILQFNKMENAFELPTFRGNICQNAKEFYLHSITIVN